MLTGQTDDAFDEVCRGVARILEYHHLPPLGLPKTIGNLVHEEIISVRKIRLHAVAAHQKRLYQEKPYEHNGANGDKGYLYDFQNRNKKASSHVVYISCLRNGFASRF